MEEKPPVKPVVALFKRSSFPAADAPPYPNHEAPATAASSLRASLQGGPARAGVALAAALDWIRAKPQVFSFVICAFIGARSVLLADYLFTLPCAVVLASVSFALMGLSLPPIPRDTIRSCAKELCVVVVGGLVVAPVVWLTIGLLILPCVLKGENDLVRAGFAAIGLLPTSLATALASTRAAQGSEPLARYLTAVSSLLCVYLSPLFVYVLLRGCCPSIQLASSMRVTGFTISASVAFVLGALLQKGISVWVRRRGGGTQEDSVHEKFLLDGPADRRNMHTDAKDAQDPSSPGSGTDPGETETTHGWREWAVQENAGIALLTAFVLFCGVASLSKGRGKEVAEVAALAAQTTASTEAYLSPGVRSATGPSSALSTWPSPVPDGGRNKSLQKPFLSGKAIFALSVLELFALVLSAAATWLCTGRVADTPDNRISVFFTGGLKSEVVTMAVFFVVLVDRESVKAALAPVAIFVVLQAVVAALLAAVLKRWRISVNCRPGTALLPPRLSQSTRNSASPPV